MKNKKGWLRVLEASIAILIILSVVLFVWQRRASTTESDIADMATPLLEEIAKNAHLREVVLADTEASNDAEKAVQIFLGDRLKVEYPHIGYNASICDINKICYLDPYPVGVGGNVYAQERAISASVYQESETIQPKKVKIFLWRK